MHFEILVFDPLKIRKKNYSEFRVKEHFSFQPLRTISSLHLYSQNPGFNYGWCSIDFERKRENTNEE